MASIFGFGPQMGLMSFLDGGGMDPNEDQKFLQSRNPQPIDPLNENTFDPNQYGLQVTDNTFQPEQGATLQEMLAQKEFQESAQPTLSQANSPLSFKYDQPEEVVRDYLGAGSPINNIPEYAFYKNRGDLADTYDPAFGELNDFTKFDKNTGDSFSMAYSDYGEEVPSLQRALGNQRFSLGQPQGIENAPQVKGMSYEQMVDLGLMGPDQDVGMTAEDLQNRPSFFGNIQNKIGSGLGSLKEFAMNKGTQGFNLARQLPGMALSAMTGIPGIGLALGALGKMGSNEYAQATLANSRKANPLGTRGVGPNGVQLDGVSDFGGFTTDDLGRITNNGLNYNTPEGIMSGYNAGFDLASSALGRIGTIQNAIEKGRFKDKFALDRANKKIDNLKTAAVASAQAKRQAYQDKIDRARNAEAREKARAKSITAGYGGGNDNDRPSTGPTSVGAGMGVGGGYASDYGFLKDGGSVGVASMFTRRG